MKVQVCHKVRFYVSAHPDNLFLFLTNIKTSNICICNLLLTL